MRNALVMLVAFCTLVLCLPTAQAQSSDREEVGKSPVEARFVSGGQVRMSLCPGAIEVTGRDDSDLRVSYTARADEEKEVRVRIQVNGDHAAIRVRGCPHNNFELRIEVPKTSNLLVSPTRIHLRFFASTAATLLRKWVFLARIFG